MSYLNIANRFCIIVAGGNDSCAIRYLLSELKHHIGEYLVHLPIIGTVDYDASLNLPDHYVELRKGVLFETDDALFISNKSNILRIKAQPECFQVTVGQKADKALAFFTVEMLIRYYAPIFDLVFLHTGSFIWKEKVCAVSAFGGVGKTEVMLKALENGAKFISDDFAIFNSKGQVFPYTKSIFLCEYPYNQYMIEKTRRSKLLWLIKAFCDYHPNSFTTRISNILEARYFGIKIDYSVLSDETPLQFYDVDSFYWVYSSSRTGEMAVNKSEFVKCMTLCLDIESRRYFDYDGYLRLKFPFLERNKERRNSIIAEISNRVEIVGLTVRDRDFDDLAHLIFQLNSH